MKAVRKMQFSVAIAILGTVLLALTQLLPLVKSPQILEAAGPSAPYGTADYAISGYRIPPVDQNVPINITIDQIHPGPVFLALFPGNGVPTGPPVYPDLSVSSVFFASVESPASQPYTLVITSVNRTTYSLRVESVWSPYYDISAYSAESVFAILAGVGGHYYFRETRRREEMEEEVRARFPEFSSRR